jgi:hypothetical protein
MSRKITYIIWAIILVITISSLFFAFNKPKDIESEISFEKYPIKEVYTGKITPLDLNSSEVANNFRTTIRASLEKGVNFAGHYVISEIGFTGYGTEIVITDAYNGKAYPFPYMAWADFKYASTSNLLVVNPEESILEYDKLGLWSQKDIKTYYFVWEDNTLISLQKDTPDNAVHF